jgi:formylglycine-generating enzyme required for sulfatase activity
MGTAEPGAGDTDLLGHSRSVTDFFIQKTEVTNGMYGLFVSEDPMWAPGNTGSLTAEGLAENDYLADWSETGTYSSSRINEPVTNVSWYAARAYCDWFTEKYLTGTGLAARLPDEPEWEYAARRDFSYDKPPLTGRLFDVDADEPGLEGLHFMSGNVWEWCRNDYALYAYTMTSGFSPDFSGGIKSVRGGSFANVPEAVPVTMRGRQPASWCTPYLGFRMVLTPSE